MHALHKRVSTITAFAAIFVAVVAFANINTNVLDQLNSRELTAQVGNVVSPYTFTRKLNPKIAVVLMNFSDLKHDETNNAADYIGVDLIGSVFSVSKYFKQATYNSFN